MSTEIVPTQKPQTQLVETQAYGALAETNSRRSMAEVQAMAIMAKQFPRNQAKAIENIKVACQRPKLAAQGLYEYAKGGTKIHGVSIRVAEVLAREWGNIQYGYIELERTPSSITAQAYAWDMETNTRAERTVTISTSMVYSGKKQTEQEYERSLTELVANQMQRRVRVCILALIPTDVVETAEEECLRTQNTNLGWNGKDGEMKRKTDIMNMVAAFGDMGVTQAQIEKRFQRRMDALEPAQFMSLRGIYTSIKEGMASVDSYFDKEPTSEDKALDSAIDKATSRIKAKAKAKAPDAPVNNTPPQDSDKEIALKEVEAWVRGGCELPEDYKIAIQQLDVRVQEGKLKAELLDDAKDVVRRIAKENGVILK